MIVAARLVRRGVPQEGGGAPGTPYICQFWSWRPAVLDVVCKADVARMRDGIDELVYDAVRESGRHTALTYKNGSRVHGDATIPYRGSS